MAKPHLIAEQVKEARRRAWAGESVKEIALDLGVAYNVVWWAIRGISWRSIKEPPPLPQGMLQKLYPARRCRNPKCRQVMAKGEHLADGLCPACYHWRLRNPGRQRDPADPRREQRIQIPDLADLYRRYRAGASVAELVEGREFSAETLRRRFVESAHQRRANTEHIRRLTPGKVEWARRLHYEDGWPISEVAERLGCNYMTLYDAVVGKTWRHAGGPLPALKPSCRCRRCGILTTQAVCHFCKEEVAA